LLITEKDPPPKKAKRMATFRCHGRLINFQMAEATCDLHGDRTREQKTLQIPRFRSFEKAGASILSPPVLRLSSLINLPARDAGCSSMPHGRHTARMEVCYEVTAGTGLPAADAL
jgi:hypothetical protein